MKKLLILTLLLILAIAAYFGWLVAGPATGFSEQTKYLYIPSTNVDKNVVLARLTKDSIVKHPYVFSWLADRKNYWNNIKPGKYKIEHGENQLNILRELKNGRQEAVNLVILKFRTKEALAGALGRKLEPDSTSFMEFLGNNDSLRQFGVDTNAVMSIIFPNTYTQYWNTTPKKVFAKFHDEHERVWTAERRQKAEAHNLTPTQAYILASIIEEETNDPDDKPVMASVYLNRLSKGIRLGADPTVKFALKNFELKRIYEKHTEVESPYNTYRNYGLPPGPICTPSVQTLDAVLNAPQTDYLFFVANSDFSGKHIFTTTFQEHLKYAKQYQEALNEWLKQHAADSTK